MSPTALLPGFPVLETLHQGTRMRLERLAGGVVRLVMARPEVRNAFDPTMVQELTDLLEGAARQSASELRLLLLEGEGEVFCAGADLAAMRDRAEASPETNRADAMALARLFRAVAAFPAPVIAAVRGAALGGGMGIATCADAVIAQEGALFGTTEVRLGILPATIGPYVLRRLGIAHAAPLMLSGRRIGAHEAAAMGLVTCLVPAQVSFGEAVAEELRSWLAAGPEAARRTKALLLTLHPLPDAELTAHTIQALSEVRATDEAKAGLTAFLEKRAAPWMEPRS